jgi:transcriptional regulator with XRE-family HTH domain
MLRWAIGRVLRRTRIAQGRTLREVAEAAGVSLPYLSEVERGRKEASSEVLASICRALGLSLVDLLDLVRAELVRVSAVSGSARGRSTSRFGRRTRTLVTCRTTRTTPPRTRASSSTSS